MDVTGVEDLFAVDRAVAHAVRAHEAFRRGLARDPAAYEDDDPLAAVRAVAGQTTLARLMGLAPSAVDGPLRDGLVRWVAELTLRRLARERDLALAKALAAPSAVVTLEAPRRVSYREARRGVAVSFAAVPARAWLEALAAAAPAVAAAARSRAELRVEVARRLGYDGPAEPSLPASRADLRASAEMLLAATDDLAADVLRYAARAEGRPRALEAYRQVAQVVSAVEGWPAQLSPRWLVEVLGPVAAGLSFDVGPLPVALSGASYGRALHRAGVALAQAAVPRSMPFALAHDPQPVRLHRAGWLFAGLLVRPVFHRRRLGLGRDRADRQARLFAEGALLEARRAATGLLLSDDRAVTDAALHEERTARLFGEALPPALAGAWPLAAEDEPARWLGLLGALEVERALVDALDEDWFANPRAGPRFRAMHGGPLREDGAAPDLLAGARALALALERALP